MKIKLLDLTFRSAQENLACDEALLEMCEEGVPHEIIRFWEPQDYFVVLGYSNKIETNVHLTACRNKKIPVLRRISGGGTVLQGPGCLNFSLILKTDNQRPIPNITKTNCYILKQNLEALEPLLKEKVAIQGHTDLTLQNIKFSGNAQCRRKKAVLFHGSFLLDFDLSLMETFLPIPELKPDYREERPHQDFLMNLNQPPELIKEVLQKKWQAEETLEAIPYAQIKKLVKEKYSKEEWSLKF